MTSGWSHRAAILGGCATGAAAVSWPLLPRAGEVLSSGRANSDLGYAIFAQWWMGESLAGRGSFFDCPLVYAPDGQNLAASVWNVVALALTGPLHWITEPVTAWNLSILLIATINGVAAFGLGHRIGARAGGIAAAAVVLCSPWMWTELFEGRIEQGLLAPLALYIWGLLNLRDRRPRAWLATGAAMGLVGATYWYMAVLGALVTLPVLGRRIRDREVWVDLARAAATSAVVALPFFLLVAPFALGEGFASVAADAKRTFDMRVTNSVTPLQGLIAHIGPANHALPLVVLGGLLWSTRLPRARPFLGALAAALILAAGPVLSWGGVPVFTPAGLVPLPLWGLDIIPGFGRFIWPYRALGIGVIAAAGAMAVVAGTLRTPGARLVGWAGLGVLLLEGRGLVLRSVGETDTQLLETAIDPQPDGAYFAHRVPEWFQQAPADSGAILTFPLAVAHAWAPLFVPIHRLPLASGDGASQLGIQPTGFRERVERIRLLSAWVRGDDITTDMAEDVPRLQALGFSWVVQFRTPGDPASDALAADLSGVFGPPLHEESSLHVWSIQ